MPYEPFPFPEAIRDTRLEDELSAVGAIYAELATETDRFQGASGISCPPDCGGRCCEGFEPDILDAEGLYLAAFILRHAPSLAERLDRPREDRTCPFWEASTGKCSCYPGRALICRAFGFSAVRDSAGELAFRLCFAMKDGKNPDGSAARDWKGSLIEASLGAVPPLMSDFGSRLVALDPSGAGSRGPLAASVKRGLDKLRLIERLLLS